MFKRPGAPSLSRRRLREWAGILVFGTFSIQCAARHTDITAFVPPQGLAGGPRQAGFAWAGILYRRGPESATGVLPWDG